MVINKKIVLLIVVVMFPLFFFGGPDYYSTRTFKNLWNLGHIIFFAFFVHLFLIENRLLRKKSFFKKLVYCLLISIVLGVAIELLQSGINRDVDITDVWRDVLGALIGFFFSPLSLNKQLLKVSQVVLIFLLLHQLIPWFMTLADEINARDQFPMLSDFESEIELTRWESGDASISISNALAYSGNGSMKVDFGTEKYSGFALKYFPNDWSEYNNLFLAIYNEGEMLNITIRIHDHLHTQGEQVYSDRYNQSMVLEKGWNTIDISLDNVAEAPETRRLDLSRVNSLGVFVTEQSARKTIFLDSVKLLR